jgi:hypothetical protein
MYEMHPALSLKTGCDTDELLRRVKGTGEGGLLRRGSDAPRAGLRVLGESPIFLSLFSVFSLFSSQSYLIISSIGALGLSDHPTPSPRGHDCQGDALAGNRGEEEEDGRGEEVGPQEDAGQRFTGEAPQSVGEGGASARGLSQH